MRAREATEPGSFQGAGAVEAFAALEAQRCYARQSLLPRRRARLAESPSAFFRGATALFYQLVRNHPGALRRVSGPCHPVLGDLHLENFGVLRLASGEQAFALNDFDEALCASPALDTLRGAASAALSAGALGLTPSTQVHIAQRFLLGYAQGELVATPPCVLSMLERAAKRERHRVLSERCEEAGGRLRFKRLPQYRPLLEREKLQVRGLFEQWCARAPSVGLAVRGKLESAAFRVRGAGSLGVARYVLVTRTLDGEPLLLEAKELRVSAVTLAGLPCAVPLRQTPAQRALEAATALLGAAPYGAIALEAELGVPASFLVRVHTPSEDRVEFSRDARSERELGELAHFEGSVLAHAHARSGGFDACYADAELRECALDLAAAMTRAWQAWCAAALPMSP